MIFPRRFAEQFVDFRAMQQQFTPPHGFMIFPIAMRILADVRVQQPGLIPGDFGEAVLQLDPPVLGRLNLGSGERKSGFEPLQQVIVVGGVTVIAQ